MTRERDRYRRASGWEQLREALIGFWRNRTARIVTAIMLGGVLGLRVLTPEFVSLSQLTVGDCIYLRPQGAVSAAGPPQVVGEPDGLLRYDGAERASCDLSHSHEVAAVFALDGYPGAPQHRVNLATCRAAFQPFVGRPADGSHYVTAVVIPSPEGWEGGQRQGACVVFNADRTFLGHRARGSRE